MTTAYSKCRKAVHVLSPLEKMGKNLAQVWSESQEARAKSYLLTHPYVQIERGFVFIHVPKTAGTSLNQALGLNAPLNSHLHSRAMEVMPFLKKLAPKVKSIAFVRNPYDRFVSLYMFARADESPYHSTYDPKSAPFGKHPDYDILSDKSLEECSELLVQGKLSRPGWNPQIDWLTDKEGPEGILIVDFIGRVESLAVDLDRLEEAYGIAAARPFPWLNKSSCPPQNAPQWTERARDLVRLYYKRDFEMLGYDE